MFAHWFRAAHYESSGEGGWAGKGVRIIDFGRTIDLSLFAPGQTFVCDWETDAFDCLEMRQGLPWTYEPDYFGAASIAFCLLFGRFIETTTSQDEPARVRINQNFKRYHQAELWTRLFDVLLNPKLVGALPITNELAEIRRELELWLEANSDRNGKSEFTSAAAAA